MVLWLKYLWSSDTITAICIVVLLLECMLCVNIFYASYTSWWEISISTTTNDDYHAQYRTFNDELWQFFKYIYMHVIDWFEICRGQIRNSWWQKYILRKIKWIEQLFLFSGISNVLFKRRNYDNKMHCNTINDPIPTMTLPLVETMKMFAEKLRAFITKSFPTAPLQ